MFLLHLAFHNLAFNVDSGHSDLQPSFDDIEEEEDGMEEVIITCDLRRIIDNVKTVSLCPREAPIPNTLHRSSSIFWSRISLLVAHSS